MPPQPEKSFVFTPEPIISMILEKTFLSNDIMDYYVVSQGKTSIPGVDDGEECELTDVRTPANDFQSNCLALS